MRQRAQRIARTSVMTVLALGASTTLVGCSSSTSPAAPRETVSLRSQEQHLLDQRAKALRTHDRALFLRGIDRGDKRLLARERTYFANLTQLPLGRFGYRVQRTSWPRLLADPRWHTRLPMPHVVVTTKLRGFDRAPSSSVTGFAFARRHGRLEIVSDRTRTGAFFPGYVAQPWDVGRVHVHRSGEVLGVFDDHTDSRAAELLSVVAAGVRDVRAAVPFSWSGHVVVYSFDDPALLSSFTRVPGGNIRHLGALTFPVYADDSDKVTVGERFTLLPSSLDAGEPFLGRIVRHELTHVAVGTRDDGDPVWFDEGLAEYVGARPLPRSERRIASVALTRARQPVDGMPASGTFNNADQDWHYALSWMACDYIAATQGEAKLWELMNDFHRGGLGTSDRDQDGVLRQVLGYGSAELAHRAADRILQLYG